MKDLALYIILILLVVALGMAFDRALDIEFPPPVATETTTMPTICNEHGTCCSDIKHL